MSDEAGGTGVANVTLKTGNGTLDATYGAITLVSYNASCCAPDVELLVVDKVGNTGSYLYSLQQNYTIALALPDRSGAGDPHKMSKSRLEIYSSDAT